MAKISSFKEFYLKEDIEIERKAKEVVAFATGKESEYFTKIAKKLVELEAAERKLTAAKNEVKAQLRKDVAEIFDQAEDALKTRKIETLSMFIAVSKVPEPRKTVQWKEVVAEIGKLFDGLQEQLDAIIEKYTKFVEVEPSVKVEIKNPDLFKEAVTIESLPEKAKSFYKKFRKWVAVFDSKLMSLKKKIRKLVKGLDD